MCLYSLIRAIHRSCFSVYRYLRFYTKEEHLAVLVPLPSELVAAIRTASLNIGLDGSELDVVHRGSVVK